jgi:hypothetical protein
VSGALVFDLGLIDRLMPGNTDKDVSVFCVEEQTTAHLDVNHGLCSQG